MKTPAPNNEVCVVAQAMKTQLNKSISSVVKDVFYLWNFNRFSSTAVLCNGGRNQQNRAKSLKLPVLPVISRI